MSRKRRSYSKEFKREAVALVTEHGYTYAEAGRSLDIEAKLVGRWRRELEEAEGEAFPGKGKLPPKEQRIRDLENQVKRLQMEKDILKNRLCAARPALTIETRDQLHSFAAGQWP